MNTKYQDSIRIIYKVLYKHPQNDNELAIYKTTNKDWSSLMKKISLMPYYEIVSAVSKLRAVMKKPTTVDKLVPLLESELIIGSVDLINSKFLFDRSPLNLQLYILSGLGITDTIFTKWKDQL